MREKGRCPGGSRGRRRSFIRGRLPLRRFTSSVSIFLQIDLEEKNNATVIMRHDDQHRERVMIPPHCIPFSFQGF